MAADGDMTTRERILKAAREAFSEKGYEGAAMAEIAKRAGVNKALIFYYFENKRNILKELMNRGSSEMLQFKDVFMRGSDPFRREALEGYFDMVLGRVESRADMVRIIMSESMKGSEEEPALFEFMGPVINEAVNYLRNLGMPVENPGLTATAELFFDAVPLFTFAVLGKRWAEYQGVEYEKAREDFFGLFKSIYVGYIYKKYFDMNK